VSRGECPLSKSGRDDCPDKKIEERIIVQKPLDGAEGTPVALPKTTLNRDAW
jgi:hypothetical protein